MGTPEKLLECGFILSLLKPIVIRAVMTTTQPKRRLGIKELTRFVREVSPAGEKRGDSCF